MECSADPTHNAKAATIECRRGLSWRAVDSCVCGPGGWSKQVRVQKVFFGAREGGGSHRFSSVRDAGMEGWGLDHSE